MKRVSINSLAAALLFGGTTIFAAAPALAVQETPAADTVEEFDAGQISDGVRAVVVEVQTALDAQDEAGNPVPADTAALLTQLQGAVPLIQNQDDRYILGSTMLQLAAKIQAQGGAAEQIQAVQQQGVQLALDSNRVELARRAGFWLVLGNAANGAEDYPTAINAYENVLRYNPDNADARIQMALANFRTGNSAAGYEQAAAAFAALRAAGQEIPSSWHTVPFRHAYEANDVPHVVQFGREFLMSHPSPTNWNEVLRVLQIAGRLEDQANLDLLRLMRATNGLDVNSINEYVRLAAQRGLPREAQTIYEASVRGQAIPANQEIAGELTSNVATDQAGLADSEASARSAAEGRVALNTADAYASYGENTKALELYDLALEKGGVEAGVVNLRRGALLYSMGRTDEARTAFEAVTGSREPHAAFWLQWLDEQAGGGAELTDETAPASGE